MLLPAIRKEWRSIWRDGRFRWTAAMLLAALAMSMTVGAQVYKRRTLAREEAEHAQREQWLNKTASNAHVAAHAGTTLFRPLAPLAALDNGIDDFAGLSVYLEPHRRNLFAHPPVENAARIGRFTELTAAITLQTVVPLLIILLTFASFAAEREQGTLRHLLSLGVHPGKLAAAKAFGLAMPILAIVAPALAVAFWLLRPIDGVRASLFAAAYLTYFALFIAIGILVSAKSRTGQNALIVLLGFWVITCFLIPRGAYAVVQRLEPTPTAQQFIEELERGEGGNFMQERAAIEGRLLAQYGVSSATELPVSTWGVTLYEREVESTRRYNDHFASLFDAYQRQQRLVDWISILSPPLAMRTVSMGLAATDVAHFRDFAEASERYRYEMVQRMNKVAVNSRLYNSSPNFAGPDQPPFPQGERAAYESVDPFSYRMPAASWALTQTRLPVAALLVWLVGLAGAAFAALRSVEAD